MGLLHLLNTKEACLFNNLFLRWLRTGDEVVINTSGDIFVVDRIKARPLIHPLSGHPR